VAVDTAFVVLIAAAAVFTVWRSLTGGG